MADHDPTCLANIFFSAVLTDPEVRGKLQNIELYPEDDTSTGDDPEQWSVEKRDAFSKIVEFALNDCGTLKRRDLPEFVRLVKKLATDAANQVPPGEKDSGASQYFSVQVTALVTYPHPHRTG